MLSDLNQKIIDCRTCPRLVTHCQQIARDKRKAYQDEVYWGKPVPGFGDPEAKLFVVGLAPGAHGANRTGRVVTGDRSGDWLYRALYKAGFSNQPHSTDIHDGLKLKGAYVSCVVRCAPPDNKPTPEELSSCLPYFQQELKLLFQVKVYVALGEIAFRSLWSQLGSGKRPTFKHGTSIPLENDKLLILSYHPSQQNTFTGRLTEPMFDSVFELVSSFLFHKA